MRLDFTILWIDDQPAQIESQRQGIDRYVRQQGFRLIPEFATTVDDAKELIANAIFDDHVDLVLIDYDLGHEKNGAEGIKEVREKFPYKDIIFYASAPDDLKKIVGDLRLQGIFCAGRAELLVTVREVFDELVRKVLDIDHSRGLAMGVTCDIDHLVKDCLVIKFEKESEESQKKTLSNVAKRLKDIKKHFDKSTSQIEKITHVAELFEHHSIYTSNDRLRLLRKMLEVDAIYKDLCGQLEAYTAKTIPARNILAHVRVVKNGLTRKLIKENKEEFSSDEMKELRTELLKCLEDLEGLHALLTKP